MRRNRDAYRVALKDAGGATQSPFQKLVEADPQRRSTEGWDWNWDTVLEKDTLSEAIAQEFLDRSLLIDGSSLLADLVDYVLTLRSSEASFGETRNVVDPAARAALETMIPPPPGPIPVSALVNYARAITALGESNTSVDLSSGARDPANTMLNASDIADAVPTLRDRELKKLQRAVAAEIAKRGTTGRAKAEPRPQAAASETTARKPETPRPDAATVRALAGLEHLQKEFAAASELPEAERARKGRQLVRAFERLQGRGVEMEPPAEVKAARRFLTPYNQRQKAAKVAALS
jgi:hypothetical protein